MWRLEDGQSCTEADTEEVSSSLVKLQSGNATGKDDELLGEIEKWVFHVMRNKSALKASMEGLLEENPKLTVHITTMSMLKLKNMQDVLDNMDGVDWTENV